MYGYTDTLCTNSEALPRSSDSSLDSTFARYIVRLAFN